MPNQLAGESSPYLLQHADNPVDWYPWGEEALSRASAEGKPIFLSVGYAACHWCHVMAHESFEDVETATFMNERFVNVKVDREERTDLDQIYMKAVVAMSGHGGWPMSVWLTPNGVPFYGGTYFPPAPRHGMPSFKQVLSALADAWENRRETIERATSEFQERLALESALSPGPHGRPLSSAASEAVRVLQAGFDRANGGWGGAPKFPQPMTIEFLLRHHARTGDETARTMAERTLKAMAGGGIYDHLGGGFHPVHRRRNLAGAALREDVVRQCAAGPRLPPCVASDRRATLSARGFRDTRLRITRDDSFFRRVLQRARRGL